MNHGIAFLHTADVHVQTFQKVVENIDPSLRVLHDVDELLLKDAIATGFTAELETRVAHQTGTVKGSMIVFKHNGVAEVSIE